MAASQSGLAVFYNAPTQHLIIAGSIPTAPPPPGGLFGNQTAYFTFDVVAKTSTAWANLGAPATTLASSLCMAIMQGVGEVDFLFLTCDTTGTGQTTIYREALKAGLLGLLMAIDSIPGVVTSNIPTAFSDGVTAVVTWPTATGFNVYTAPAGTWVFATQALSFPVAEGPNPPSWVGVAVTNQGVFVFPYYTGGNVYVAVDSGAGFGPQALLGNLSTEDQVWAAPIGIVGHAPCGMMISTPYQQPT
jgi:hypothetical protein